MRQLFKSLAVFVIVMMLFTAVPSAIRAETMGPAERVVIHGGTWVNPLADDIPEQGEDPNVILPPDLPNGSETVITTEEAIESFRQHFVNRDASFSATVPMPDGILTEYTWYLVKHAMDHTGVPDEGDYIVSQFSRINWDVEQTEETLTVLITAAYRTTRAQENQVDQKVAQIISELELPKENDYETFRAVYDYLTSHVVFPDNNTSIAHTAYGALINNSAVCQGFAAALYRLCLEAGIDCRYCSSTAQKHGWNIVGLGGEYYLTDSTWDRIRNESSFYRYCLCGTEDWLTRHIASNEALTTIGDEFYSKNDPNGNLADPWFAPLEQYPLSAVGFEEGRHLLTVDFVYPDGTPAAESHNEMAWACESYDVPVPVIAGYTASMNEVSGSMAGHDLTITVEYVPEGHEHEWDGGTVATSATCTDCGVRTYACSCGATRIETIAPTGHSISNSRCSRCGVTVTAYGSSYIRGSKAKWTLETNGKLTVFGVGIMGVFSTSYTPPWQSYDTDITSVEIKEGITTISALAFEDCTNLSDVSLPDGLISICRNAFHSCTSLTELESPDSLQVMDKNAFLDAGLTSLSLGTGAYYFGPDCFSGNDGLAEVSYAGTLERWCYADVKKENGNPGWTASSFTIAGEEVSGEISIPEPVRKVRPFTFVNRGLTQVDFPETLEKIEKGAFSGNTGLDVMVFTGDCPEAGEGVVNDASFVIHYPCANDTWNGDSMAELSGESHMPGCTVEEWCVDHLWDEGTTVTENGHSFIRYTCLRCGATNDGPGSETTSITLNKSWNDGNDQDGIRPNSVTVNVVGKLANGTVVVQPFAVTITVAEGWSKTVSGLDKYSPQGQLITYSIQSENAVSGYTASISGLSVTNTHTPGVTWASAQKVWNDGNDQDGMRPSSISVTLTGKVGSTTVYTNTKTLNASNNWYYKWENLPQKNNGTAITYTVTENVSVSGYTTSYSHSGNAYTITNSHTPGVTWASAQKVWNDGDDRDGLRPSGVSVTLTGKAGSTTVYTDTKTLSASNSWFYKWENLPQKHNGTTITYTVTENVSVSGYTTTYSHSVNAYTITNTHEPEKISIQLEKIWEDENDRLGLRPEDVTVYVTGKLADGTIVVQPFAVTIAAAENWSKTVSGLYKYYPQGQLITYGIQSEEAVNGYTSVISGLSVTNTLEDVPPVEFGLEAMVVVGGIELTYPDTPDAAVYEIFRRTGEEEFARIGETAEKTYLDTTVDVLTTYEYQVRITGGESNVAEATTYRFLDVLPDMACNKAVNWAVDNDIVRGTSGTTFSPDADCTRGQFALMLYRLAGKPVVDMSTNPFTDLPDNAGIRRAIVWAYNEGIVNGTSDTTYSPDAKITRYQLVLMLYKMAGKPSVAGMSNPFEDLDGLSSNTVKAITWAYNEGIVKGTGATTFGPRANCTRGQLVIMLYRYNRLMGLVPMNAGPAVTAEKRTGLLREV